MRIAVTYENGEIFQHFGHTERFKVYDVEGGRVSVTAVVNTNGSGHGALADILKKLQVDTLICGGIGGGARAALDAAGIQLYGGVSGVHNVHFRNAESGFMAAQWAMRMMRLRLCSTARSHITPPCNAAIMGRIMNAASMAARSMKKRTPAEAMPAADMTPANNHRKKAAGQRNPVLCPAHFIHCRKMRRYTAAKAYFSRYSSYCALNCGCSALSASTY